MTQKTKLPDYSPLFKPRWSGDVGGYTKEQLQAYGAACAAHARDMALFTRPMPPQIIGLQDVHDAVTADPTLADCAQDVTELVEALEKLARLGNGEHYGNSDGNMIARMALSRYKGAK